MSYTTLNLSPAELSYLYTSLSQPAVPTDGNTYHHHTGPIRPDSRTPTQFRPLIAETDILPSCFGSARVIIGGGEGGECIVGIKAEVEKSTRRQVQRDDEQGTQDQGWKTWIEVNVDTQGLRDDDSLNVVIQSVVAEALWSAEGGRGGQHDNGLVNKLRINDRFHWKLYIDALLIIPPAVTPLSSHPLTLASLSVFLALISTSIPLRTSEGNEDPMFSDDWDQAIPLYPKTSQEKPPISLVAMSVGGNIFVDPSREELSVAEGVWVISVDCSRLPYPKAGGERKRKSNVLGIRTLESFCSATVPAPNGVESDGRSGLNAVPPGVVGGRGAASLQTLKNVIKSVSSVAEEVWEALERVAER